jgi:hypothetical protein
MRESFKDTPEEVLEYTNHIFKQMGRNVTKENGVTFRAIYDSLYSSPVGTRFNMNVPKGTISEIIPGTRLKLDHESVVVINMMQSYSYDILYCEIINEKQS